MFKNKKIACLITARSGSKGLKDKNIKKIKKLSLIEHVIKESKKSKYIDETYISTDSLRYIKIAKKAGAIIPFKRPKKLSLDNSSSFSVIEHFLDYLKKQDNKKYNILVLLEPTSPMTSFKDIDYCLKSLIFDKRADSLVGISKIEKYDLKSVFTLSKDFLLENVNGKIINNFNRFKNDDLFFLDGSIYISKIDKLLSNKGFISKKTKGYIFPYHKSFEVDNMTDLKIIKSIFKK